MLLGMPLSPSNTPNEKLLLKLFSTLDDTNQASVLAFTEFLVQRVQAASVTTTPSVPQLTPRPVQETVVNALRRLRASYSMISEDKVLQASAALMTAHIMQGRPAADVIDDLEALFANEYQRLCLPQGL